MKFVASARSYGLVLRHFDEPVRVQVVTLYDIEMIFQGGKLVAVSTKDDFIGRSRFPVKEVESKLMRTSVYIGYKNAEVIPRDQLKRKLQELLAKRAMKYLDAILIGENEV